MAGFSYGKAAGAGFAIIGRRPWVVLIWAAAYLLLVALPIFASVFRVLPDLVAGYREAALQAAQHHPADPAKLLALQSRIFGLQPVVWLVQIVSRAILMGAIYRAVLEPENSKWGYLRLSSQELWLGLTNLVFIVMAAVMILTVFIPISIALGIGVASAERGASPGLAALVLLFAVAVVGWGVILWVLTRLCLAMPMAFAQRRFALYESWALTRGAGLKIFLVMLSLFALVWVLEAIGGFVLWQTVVRGIVGHPDWRARLQAPATEVAHNLVPLMIGFAVVGSVIGMTIYTILVAPLASMYQQLTAASEPAA